MILRKNKGYFKFKTIEEVEKAEENMKDTNSLFDSDLINEDEFRELPENQFLKKKIYIK